MKLPVKKISLVKPLTIARISGKLFILQKATVDRQVQIQLSESTDGRQFTRSKKSFSISNLVKKSENINNLSYISIGEEKGKYTAVVKFEDRCYSALSRNGFSWTLQRLIPKKIQNVSFVEGVMYKDWKILYWSDNAVHIGFSKNGQIWTLYDDPIYEPEVSSEEKIYLLNSIVGSNEIVIPVTRISKSGEKTHVSISAAIFSKENPQKIARRYTYPLFVVDDNLASEIASPLGTVVLNDHLYSFWESKHSHKIIVIALPPFDAFIIPTKTSFRATSPAATLKKVNHNPILSPDPELSWQSKAVFNPAALYDEEEKKVHLMYRAVGDSWTSVFGYAVSNDGVTISSKHPVPAYYPRASFEGVYVAPDPNSPFTSGPGIGGCEDPRLTKIGKRVYLTYVAYDGSTGPRVALSSIDYEDFKKNIWNWSAPIIISKPGVIDKNACIFPEKIRGKYVIMHRIFPYILIDYVDSLDFDGNTFLKGEYKIGPRARCWDSRKVGAGPPPIKTDEGWLLIYHAVDDKKDHQYHFGAMLLDLENPSRVICRSSQPIISPTHWYENEGHKSGVVYPCGAIVKDKLLHVYYGGADTYMCAATAPLSEFISSLKNNQNNFSRSFIN